MEEKKKKFSFGTYKPPILGKKEMDDGLKRALKGTGQTLKPLNISGQQRKPEKSTFMQEPKEEKEDEPYWSAEQWEEWAYNLYKNYAETHEYLPDWFLEAMEDEE